MKLIGVAAAAFDNEEGHDIDPQFEGRRVGNHVLVLRHQAADRAPAPYHRLVGWYPVRLTLFVSLLA